MRSIIDFIGFLLLFFVLISIAIVAIVLWAMGIGWLINLFFTFTLFESSMLALAGSIVFGLSIHLVALELPARTSILKNKNNDNSDDKNSHVITNKTDEHDWWLKQDFTIPITRFSQSEIDDTPLGKSYVSCKLANSFLKMGEEEVKLRKLFSDENGVELAIRLANVVVPILERKHAGTKNLSISLSILKSQMKRLEQRPYDDDILGMVMSVTNKLLNHDDIMIGVIREKEWNKPID